MSRTRAQVWLPLACCVLLAGCATPTQKYFKEPSSANVYVAPRQDAQIRRVAVLPLNAPTELIGSAMSDLISTEMLHTGRYTLVERSQLAQVLGESELALAGLTAARAAEVGRMAGADGVILGTVLEYGTHAHRGRTYSVVGIAMRLIDTQKGSIAWSADLSRRAEKHETPLSVHARSVVHELAAGVFQAWSRQK